MNSSFLSSLKILFTGIVALSLFSGCHAPKSMPEPQVKRDPLTDTQRQTVVVTQNTPENPNDQKELQSSYEKLDLELQWLQVRIAKLHGKDRVLVETQLDEFKKRRSDLQIHFDSEKYQQLLQELQNTIPEKPTP
ncbi:MAG: hypothetical protein V4507_11505 [Verrucomicrobiota bacterium]